MSNKRWKFPLNVWMFLSKLFEGICDSTETQANATVHKIGLFQEVATKTLPIQNSVLIDSKLSHQ